MQITFFRVRFLINYPVIYVPIGIRKTIIEFLYNSNVS